MMLNGHLVKVIVMINKPILLNSSAGLLDPWQSELKTD